MENTKQIQKVTANFTQEQIDLIHNTVAKGTTKDEFALFLYTANKYRLDPLIKQIWCVKYGNEPAAIFTGRDGFLSKSHESGQFNGMKTSVRIEPVPFAKKVKKKGYNGKPDEWVDFKKETQLVATTLVYRKDMEYPIEVEVWEEEYSSGQSNWIKMPRTMISKVSESQALRKAFDISGIYSEEEQGAFQEPQPTIEVEGVEVLSEEIQKQIDECKSRAELNNIWNENKVIQKKTFFMSAVEKRVKELQVIPEPAKTPAAPTHELPEGITTDILTCETIKQLNALIDSKPELKGNKKFSDMVNARKIEIGKGLSKAVAR